MTKSATLQRIRITPELKVRLERLAQDDRRTVSDYVRLVLEQHVKSAECFGELAMTDQIAPSSKLEKYQPGDVVTVRFHGNEFTKAVE